jgi:chloramphenicol-sensitive protein RarD
MNRGIVYALSAYIFWGLHPVYWKMLHRVPSYEIISHRMFWSFIFFIIIITWRKDWSSLFSKIKTCQNRSILFVPALLIGANWATYIWAVSAGYIVETSLGYFISPLVNVFAGVLFLHERLRPVQWLAVGIAGMGVLAMTLLYGVFPWISLFLAFTWGIYCLLRKKSPLDAVEGLTLETTLLSVPALAFLLYRYTIVSSPLPALLPDTALLIGTGIISGLPLIVFIIGARLVKLSVIGIIQYIYPILLMLTGVFIYHETLNTAKMTGFIIIWIALIIYSVESALYYRNRKNGTVAVS